MPEPTPPIPNHSGFDPVAMFGTRWDPGAAGQFGWRLHSGSMQDGTRVIILQLDTSIGRIALPMSHESVKMLIRQLEELVTGLVLPPP